MKKLILASTLALGLVSGLFADNITFVPVNGGAAAGSPKINFDNLNLGSATQVVNSDLTVSFADGAAVVQPPNVNGVYAAPFVSGSNGIGFGSPNQLFGQDQTRFLSTGIGSVTLQFSSSQKYFGLLWGSVDDYNTLSFYSGGTLLDAFTGSEIWASANGDQGQQGTFYVNFNDLDGSFDKVVATSSNFAFEFDNVAYNANTRNVPDGGATIALLGLACVGLVAFRRKR
jgi:hypothetical protein